MSTSEIIPALVGITNAVMDSGRALCELAKYGGLLTDADAEALRFAAMRTRQATDAIRQIQAKFERGADRLLRDIEKGKSNG